MMGVVRDRWEEFKWDLRHDRWAIALLISVLLLFWWLLPITFGIRAIIASWKASKLLTIITGFNLTFALIMVSVFIIDYTDALNIYLCN